MTDARDLTIVIPTLRRWDVLGRTLAALREQDVAGFEVVVVVDGDRHEVPGGLDADRVVVQGHAGPGVARNTGVATSDRPLVLFLGDDMIPDPGLVSAHLRRHAARPAVEEAVLGHVDWHPEVSDSRLLRWMDWSGTQFDFVHLADQADQDVTFARFYSCNVSLKRELFDAVGGFDPDFLFYYEDLDLGWRLGQAGMVLRYAPEARTAHLHDYDLAGVRRRFEGIALGERLMAAKHPWFEPWFHGRVSRAAARPPVASWWPHVADRLPRTGPGPVGRLARRARREANRWYHQQLAEGFLAAWEAAGDVVELRSYLGEDFDARLVAHHDRAVAEEFATHDDEAEFYRSSTAYLYDLTVFGMSGTKDPYRAELRRHVAPGARLLDFGCGIGADGLVLTAEGYDVVFADLDNPSTRYLRWRLEQRGWSAPVLDVERDELPEVDAAYAFDVLEHVPDPFDVLSRLEAVAGLVVVNLLEDDPDDPEHELHHELPIGDLLDHARSRGLVSHTRHHDGRSHLLVYRGS